MSNTSIGFDPEFFVMNRTTGRTTPICGILGGTKRRPIEFKDYPGYYFHEDNVVAELGVPPAYSVDEAHDILNLGIGLMEKELSKHDLKMIFRGSYQFMLNSLTHPNAHEFGCEPDYCAYSGKSGPRTGIPDFGRVRFAGGHIHIGGDFNCPKYVVALFCDLFWSTKTKFLRYDTRRASWYGAAGSYRMKKYGIEYRTPDSKWLQYDDTRRSIIEGIWDLAQWLEDTPAPRIKEVMEAINWMEIRNRINNGCSSKSVLIVARNYGVPV